MIVLSASLHIFLMLVVLQVDPLGAPAVRANRVEPPPQTVRKSPEDLEKLVHKRTKPDYPPMAKAARVAGTVQVEVLINERGEVEFARAVSGHPLLKEAAVKAARAWVFTPSFVDGTPIRVIGTLTIAFDLEGSPRDEDKGRAAREIRKAEGRVTSDPFSAEAHIDLAEAYMNGKRYEDAVGSYKSALSLSPNDEYAFEGLAEAYEEMERYDEAIDLCRRALEVFPDSLTFLRRLVTALERKNRVTEAIEVQKRIIASDPDVPGHHSTLGWLLNRDRKHEEAIAAFEEALTLRPGDGYALFSLGLAYHSVERYDEAIDAYRRSLETKSPYSPGVAHANISMALRKQKRFFEAIEEAELALRAGSNWEVFVALGGAYHDVGQYDNALRALNDARALGVEDWRLFAALGDVHSHLRNLPEAEKASRESLRLKPDAASSHFALAAALFGQKKEGAEEALRRGLELAPESTNGHVLLARMLSHQGRHEDAEAQYRRALQIEPDNPLLLNNLGYSMVERDANLEEALAMIRRAVEAQPQNGSFVDSLGWALFKLGRIDEAEPHLIEAARLNPSSPAIQDHLGELHKLRGRYKEALACWKKAIGQESEPDRVAKLEAKIKDLTERQQRDL